MFGFLMLGSPEETIKPTQVETSPSLEEKVDLEQYLYGNWAKDYDYGREYREAKNRFEKCLNESVKLNPLDHENYMDVVVKRAKGIEVSFVPDENTDAYKSIVELAKAGRYLRNMFYLELQSRPWKFLESDSDMLSPHISLLGSAYWHLINLGFKQDDILFRIIDFSKYEAVNIVNMRDPSKVDRELRGYILPVDEINEDDASEDLKEWGLRDFEKIHLAYDKKFPMK